MGKRLAEVHAAGLFLYRGKDISIKMDDLFDDPLAVILRGCESVANACPPSTMPSGDGRVGFGVVVRGSARKEYGCTF
jgi:hypothetical protein